MLNPKTTLILDSTQITDFLTCPSLWAFGHRERLEPVSAETKEAMTIGTYGHKLLELYYKSMANYDTLQNQIIATGKALAYDFDKETCRCQHSTDQHGGIDKAPTACTHIGCDCLCFEPSTFPLDLPVRELVRQRFREYTYTYGGPRDIQPHSPDTVEVGFSYPLLEDSQRCYVLEGRIDLLGTFSSQQAWLDHKFQMRMHTLYSKSIQFRNYAMVCNLTLGVINYVRMTKGVTKDTFSRQVVSFTPDEHRRWKTELIGIFDAVAGAVTAEDFPNGTFWKNRSACPGRFGYPCQFTSLCEEHDPKLIEIKQTTMYRVKPVWSPW